MRCASSTQGAEDESRKHETPNTRNRAEISPFVLSNFRAFVILLRKEATMQYEQIRYEVDAGVLTITLSRPDKLNAFTERMMREMIDAFDQADADDSVRVIIVTGAGRAFCAGADLSGGSGTFDHAHGTQPPAIDAHRDGGGLLTLRIFESKKPVIAAINGPAVGVGITMTLPMD